MSGDTKVRPRRAGAVLNWAVALLVLATFAAGLVADEVPSSLDEPYYYMVHGSLGITLLIVLIVAIAWSLVRPRSRAGEIAPQWQDGAGRLLQLGLFITTLAAVLFGWALMSLEYPQVEPLLFGYFSMPIPVYVSPVFNDLFEDGHEFFAYAAVLLAGLHVLAGLWQHYAKDDSTGHAVLPRQSQ